MAKKGKKDSSSANSKTPRCSCDDAYRCSCGNRPPRPSKGHKWDPETQAWGGKGHKQKGASGQIASVAQKATTTSVGQTTVAQWQRLPSQLLEEYCRKNKKPPPKYKSILDNTKFQYRVIVPDGKNSQKDLFFVPMHAVGNEEQAREEASLLALLSLTPSLPHERILPEPFRTTWLNAIAQQSKQTSKVQSEEADPSSASGTCTIAKNKSKAQPSAELKLATTYTSLGDQQKQLDEKRRQKNRRMQQHEALRMANRNHVVTMSAPIRRQIERLLRDEKVDWDEINESENEEEEDPAEDDVQFYVQDRLHREGFSRKQARTAFREVMKASTRVQKISQKNNSEEEWDVAFEEVLQWLLVHLDEDQLPDGIDPEKGNIMLETGRARTDIPTSVQGLGSDWGLSSAEVKLVQANIESRNVNGVKDFETVLWSMLVEKAGVKFQNHKTDSVAVSDEQKDSNRAIFQEEIEALSAIYSSDFKISSTSDLQSIEIVSCDGEMILHILIRDGYYPTYPPERVWLTGKWGSCFVGSAFHIELIQFLGERPSGDPMIFELRGQVQILYQTKDELPSQKLMEISGWNPIAKSQRKMVCNDSPVISTPSTHVHSTHHRSPREIKPFWSRPPSETLEAVSFPKIGGSMQMARKSLPAAKSRDDFLMLLRQAESSGRVLLLTGETGCGKTTQIPQYILEEYPRDAKIVVAQPRRLAATGVATRVAAERGESRPGVGSVGYVVRGDSAICDKSRLVFCTTGVLLRQLQSKKPLECITHIVVDEVHERHLDTDVLLGLLKKYLLIYPHLKVILMSATLDADRFADYWKGDTPRMHIPGRTFPVKDYMLEDVLALTGYIPRRKQHCNKSMDSRMKRSTPWIDSEISEEEEEDEPSNPVIQPPVGAVKLGPDAVDEVLRKIDESNIDYDLLATLVIYLLQTRSATDNGSILIFLPGALEINKAIETIQQTSADLPILLLPLHGGLQPQEQSKVFVSAERGFTKVIVSTNVAETSITIPDCTIVIDSAKEKQSSYDPVNRMPLLVERFASKASLQQRRGRAGRVRDGYCYKLISNATYNELQEHSEPEIRRSALEQTLLTLLYLGVESGSGDFFQTLLDPPSTESLKAAERSLFQLSAIERVKAGLILTPLGLHLAGIPAPPTIGKMLIMGCILGCREAAVAMAAGLSVGRSPFIRMDSTRAQKSTVDKSTAILRARSDLSESVGVSDHALIAALFSQWRGVNKNDNSSRRTICDAFGLSFSIMREMDQLAKQFDAALVGLGFTSSEDSDRNKKSWRVVRACATAALAPSQLVKVIRPPTKYERTTEGAKERHTIARELKFMIRSVDHEENDSGQSSEERVFIHPSSASFSTGSFSCPWLVFHSMVRTSKPFLSDITECNSYPLLLFGGPLEVQASQGIATIDGWVQLSVNSRIGSLMSGLRRKVDLLLSKKVQDPSFEVANTEEMKLIIKLITRDGQI